MIRLALEQDILRVNELRRQVNDLHVQGRPDVFKAGFAQELAAAVTEFMAHDDADVIVCERDGVVCGFAMLKCKHRPETVYGRARSFLDVEEIGVDCAYRRQGVGHEMMQWIKRYAVSKGFSKVELNMWSFNEGALTFYEQEGFGTYRRYMEWTVDEQGIND